MNNSQTIPPLSLILASGSTYKKTVLAKLGLAFESISPDVDETPLPDESPTELVTRLAQSKAQKVCSDLDKKQDDERPQFIIGVDQIAVHNDNVIGKPGDIESAIKQLLNFSGQHVSFLTGICLLRNDKTLETMVEPFDVHFKPLTRRQVIRYIDAEMPLDCAGSFKCEGQGILLFSALSGRDPNALIGMPLIALQELFMRFEIDLFEYIEAV